MWMAKLRLHMKIIGGIVSGSMADPRVLFGSGSSQRNEVGAGFQNMVGSGFRNVVGSRSGLNIHLKLNLHYTYIDQRDNTVLKYQL